MLMIKTSTTPLDPRRSVRRDILDCDVYYQLYRYIFQSLLYLATKHLSSCVTYIGTTFTDNFLS